MSDFYIYSSKYDKLNKHEEKTHVSVTVIFCPADGLSETSIQNEIKEFYQNNYQTDEIIIIGGTYQKEKLLDIFINNQQSTFKYIPKLREDHLAENVYIYLYNKDGRLSCLYGIKQKSIEYKALLNLLNIGLVLIFMDRGGLIEAKGDAHHFVFPSGKHCDKFLRTGNVLMNTSEIYFIAFCLLKCFKEEQHKKIYCDTSSISTLAFALVDLKRRFVKKLPIIPFESFSSYEGLFSKRVRFFENSLILVSSSTSGNIVDRIMEHDVSVKSENIIIIYFLGLKKEFKKREHNVLCDLTLSENNPSGIKIYDTYIEKECGFCAKGSYPVEVKGDVFLLEKPKINKINIKVTDAPKRLSEFVEQFIAFKRTEELVFKVNYKEKNDSNRKYDIYFDIFNVLNNIERNGGNTRYTKYSAKLYDYINQYIPSNTKYIIALPDEGSIKLSEMILAHIKSNYKVNSEPIIVKFDEVVAKISDEEIAGAAIIVGSCITNGKNLLFLSRAFRNFLRLKLIYFIGLTRTNNQEDLEFLKSNLRQGNYGKETNSFVEVERFFCNNDSKSTTWLNEKEFILSKLIPLAERKKLVTAENILNERLSIIDESFSNLTKGLANNLFYDNTSGAPLALRKGFAFINFENHFQDLSQADVYFTISAIVNQLRNTENQAHCLKQSEYVRNLLDPGNFNRFNDGIIQASILRAAKQSELAYRIDENLSLNMRIILEKIISAHNTPQGEVLIEFLYSIATQKLTIKKEHLDQLSKLIDEIHDNELVLLLNHFIKENYLSDKPTLNETIQKLESQIEVLKKQLSSV